MLPGMRVVGAGLTGLMVVVEGDHRRHSVVRTENRVGVIDLVLNYRFQYLLPEMLVPRTNEACPVHASKTQDTHNTEIVIFTMNRLPRLALRCLRGGW